MDTGIQLLFARFGYEAMSDAQVWEEEIALSEMAEPLGFGSIWAVEHHFFDLSICPDNLQVLTYLAARTKQVSLGTAAIILPWNDPLRVAEKIAVLDQLSAGRLQIGFGRGASAREYAPFTGVKLEESRQRFSESAAMIVAALETGTIKGSGPFYPQTEIEIRPKPVGSFKGRIFVATTSRESIDACLAIGGRLLMTGDPDWSKRLESVDYYNNTFQEMYKTKPLPPKIHDLTYCHANPAIARERGEQYLSKIVDSGLAAGLMTGSMDKLRHDFTRANAHGTPDQILDQLEKRRKVIGNFDVGACFRFGGVPYEQARESMTLYAKEVLPVVKAWC